MSTRPTRRSLMGSYRYGIIIKSAEKEFSGTMNGSIDMYDGKHVIESQKFSSFDQLANTIMSFWEKKIGSEVNVHRFSNWLSEYFSDIGITNINFYQLIETVRNLGRGVSLHSSGFEIREAKVVREPLIPRSKEEEQPKTEQPSDSTLKPSELFQQTKTESPKVTVLPPLRKEKEEEKEKPPDDTLLKPSDILKKKEIAVVLEEKPAIPSMGVGDPIVTRPSPKIVKESPPTETLLRPSEYLKTRETIDAIYDSPSRPSKLPEQKKIKSVKSKPKAQRKLAPPSGILLRPNEYLRMRRELEEKKVEHIGKTREKIQEDGDSVLKSPLRIDPKESKIPEPPKTVEKKEIKKPEPTKVVAKKKEPSLPFEIEILEEDEAEKLVEDEIKAVEEKLVINIIDIMGVGEKTAMLLKEGGFDNIEKIISSTPEELSKVRGIGITTAKKLIYGAKALKQKKQ